MNHKNNHLKIGVSITDFPIFRSLEHSFKEVKKTGADGVEIVHGLKSHWPFKKVKKLSEKYGLPIFSVHQPLWTGIGVPDFSFIKFARNLGVKNIVIHPLPKLKLDSEKMKKYFQKMADFQKKYNLEILLENLPVDKQAAVLDRYFPAGPEALDPLKIWEVAKKYGFKVNLDTSHLEQTNPEKNPWFDEIVSYIGNIHLSNFDDKKAHLPIHMGKMDHQSFLNSLKKNGYKGLITLEVYYPKMIALRNYDYSEIKKSIEIIRKLFNV